MSTSKSIVAAMALLVLICIALYLFCPKPELKGYHTYSRAYFDRNGILLRITIAQDDQYRLYAPLEKISPYFQEATLLYEDQDFYQHAGIDVPALCRAFWDTYIIRNRKIGASTITMQVARLRWDIKSQTVSGKISQILRALQLTRHYSKNDILEAYFNLASYGRNIEGIEAAGLIYFNKHANALSLAEALTLCVIPQNPGKRNPTIEKGLVELRNARENIFRRWIEHHPEDKNKKIFIDLALNVRSPEELPFRAPHFVSDLDSQLSWSQHGQIQTTLDYNQQTVMEQIVTRFIERRKFEGIHNASAMLLDYRTMEVKALVGSANFYDPAIQGQVNGATAKRSPGSALKPFVYALSMDKGLIHPMSLLKDAPKRFAGFSPENFDQRFMGPVFAKDALITSRNVPAVNLQAQLSKPNLYDLLQHAGIADLREESFYGLALALGGVEVTMEELVSLYAMFPNHGEMRPLRKVLYPMPEANPSFVRHSYPAQKTGINCGRNPESSIKQLDSNKNAQETKTWYEESKTSNNRLISPEACFLIMDILKDNPRPQSAKLSGQVHDDNEIAWKTGTSYAFRDAWAVGISGQYVLAVWVGNFKGNGNPNFIGRLAAGPLLFEIFNAINTEKKWCLADALPPGLFNLTKVTVCAKTGDLAVKYCPTTTESWFIPGVSPIKVSSIHRAIPIDKETGFRSCRYDSEKTEMKIYEFWPSDLSHIYQLAGISLKTPPSYASDCSMDEKSTSGQAPFIQSPQPTVTYALQSQKLDVERIPFSAVVDADVRTLYWFVGNQFVGQVSKETPFFWKPSNGTYNVRVVDDHGRAAECHVTVKVVR